MNTAIRLVGQRQVRDSSGRSRKPSPIKPLEFDVPVEATRGGELTLTFSAPPGLGSAGRGNQIAEVWLMRKVDGQRLGEPGQARGCASRSRSSGAPSPPAASTSRRGRRRAGFHFLWLELEHSPLTLETVRNIVLATRGLPAVPFARVPVTETWTAKRVLDAGVHGVMFPFVSTPALAQQAADACRYPPAGRRGSGASLATSCWPEPDGYYDSADRNIARGRDHRGGGSARARRRDCRHAWRGRGVHRHGRPLVLAGAARAAGSPARRGGRARGARRGAPAWQGRRPARRVDRGDTSATSSRASCFSRRRPSSRCSRRERSGFLGPHGVRQGIAERYGRNREGLPPHRPFTIHCLTPSPLTRSERHPQRQLHDARVAGS